MLGRLGWTVTLLLVTLTMGLEFAHLLEWQPKAEYPGALYVRLQESLYVWFGTVGAVLYVAAILATVALAVVRRRDRPPLVPLAALAEIVALVTFLVFIFPVNQRFPIHSAGTVPPDWTALRDRWEITHAGGFVLFAAAFLLLFSAARHTEVPAQPLTR
ncbi:MAG: hypothetical protein ACRDQ5_10075 [Sciscionella sp.]